MGVNMTNYIIKGTFDRQIVSYEGLSYILTIKGSSTRLTKRERLELAKLLLKELEI